MMSAGKRVIRVPDRSVNHRFCAVIVVGDSLRDAGIQSGDVAVCRMQKHLDYDGQLTAVLTPSGLTLKYVFKDFEDKVRLEGANSNYLPQWYDAQDVSFQGVVVRIERDF